MHIVIDGRTIVRNRTGVGVYADRLVRSLLQVDQRNNYSIFLVEDDPTLVAPNLEKILIDGYDRMGPNRFWENFVLPRYLKENNADIYFSPGYLLPLLIRSADAFRRSRRPGYVVTLHDLVAFTYPETFTLKMRLWQRLFVSNAARVADRILASSEATKRDLERFLTISDERITVVHLSVDPQFRPIRDDELLQKIRTQYNLPPKFVLYLGTLEPRKNVVRLAQAYAMLPAMVRQEHPLILAGGSGWYSRKIRDEIDQLHLGDRIRSLGYVEDRALPSLYTLASVFVYPSLYEGFGFPPLEAMACGTPVICSRASSLPEVVGDAGVLVDPFDVKEIATQLERLLTDGAARRNFSQAGLERAKRFDPREQAREVLGVFEEVAATKAH